MKKPCMLAVVVVVVGAAMPCHSASVFTDEASILGVSRDDQANAVKAGLIKKELTLTEVIRVLTTYSVVSREEYLVYAHGLGVHGSLTTKDGATSLWEIEPDYAATVVDHHGGKIYLLRPDLIRKSTAEPVR